MTRIPRHVLREAEQDAGTAWLPMTIWRTKDREARWQWGHAFWTPQAEAIPVVTIIPQRYWIAAH